jgi:hypothetical protein
VIYDLISFFFRRSSTNAFALCAHATKYMDATQLAIASSYFAALSQSRIASGGKIESIKCETHMTVISKAEGDSDEQH